MPIDHEIGKKIRDFRLNKNMSQDRFAKKIGISGKSISAYENGTCRPSLKVMESINLVYNDFDISSENRNSLIEKITLLKEQLLELEKILLNK